jgi:hypothetical protein
MVMTSAVHEAGEKVRVKPQEKTSHLPVPFSANSVITISQRATLSICTMPKFTAGILLDNHHTLNNNVIKIK